MLLVPVFNFVDVEGLLLGEDVEGGRVERLVEPKLDVGIFCDKFLVKFDSMGAISLKELLVPVWNGEFSELVKLQIVQGGRGFGCKNIAWY